jgi:hypothetical protein
LLQGENVVQAGRERERGNEMKKRGSRSAEIAQTALSQEVGEGK